MICEKIAFLQQTPHKNLRKFSRNGCAQNVEYVESKRPEVQMFKTQCRKLKTCLFLIRARAGALHLLKNEGSVPRGFTSRTRKCRNRKLCLAAVLYIGYALHRARAGALHRAKHESSPMRGLTTAMRSCINHKLCPTAPF